MTEFIVFFLILLGTFGLIKLYELALRLWKELVEHFWEGEE
jgi:hypothetical protein